MQEMLILQLDIEIKSILFSINLSLKTTTCRGGGAYRELTCNTATATYNYAEPQGRAPSSPTG